MAKKGAEGTPTVRLDIDRVLKERGRSAYWLANELGMGHGNLYRYRKGQVNAVNLKVLAKMCMVLECAPGDLLALDGDKVVAGRKVRSKAR